MPDQEFGEIYVPRSMPSKKYPTDIAVLEACIRGVEKDGKLIRANSLLLGPTGLGKTSAVLAVCAKNTWPLLTANCNGMTTVEDLVGQLMPREHDQAAFNDLIEPIIQSKLNDLEARANPDLNVETKNRQIMAATADRLRAEYRLQVAMQMAEFDYIPGLATMAAAGDRNFDCSVLLLDELNMAPARVLAVVNSLTDHRRYLVLSHGELVRAHEGCHFSGGYNPGYEGTRPLNPALKDRFPIKIPFDYDPDLEIQLTQSPKLVEFAKMVRDARHEVESPTSTRMLLQFVDVKAMFGLQFAIQNLCSSFDDGPEREAVARIAELKLKSATPATPMPAPPPRIT